MVTEKELEEEIKEITKTDKEYGKGGTFLPFYYRKERKRGKTKEEVLRNYDSCHVWR